MDIPIDSFIAEARELIQVLESGLLTIESHSELGQIDSELLNDIFRAAHTIKGSAGLFGLEYVVEFTHDLENILDRARDGELEITVDLNSVLLKATDYLSLLIETCAEQQPITPDIVGKGYEITELLSPWLDDDESEPELIETAATTEPDDFNHCWVISWSMQRDALKNGLDPIAIIKFLSNIGTLEYCAIDDSDCPEDEFDPEALYLKFAVALTSNASKEDIEDAFLFVKDESDIKIVAPQSAVEKYIEAIKHQKNKGAKLGEILIQAGVINQEQLEKALNIQSELELPKKQLGEILHEKTGVSQDVVNVAVTQQKIQRVTGGKSIRVDSARLDELINLVGELVINQQAIGVHNERIGDSLLDESVNSMVGLTEQVRDAALNLRMVQIGETFQRFRRVVRDTASELGKDIELVLIGEETELDRSMVEKVTDPLTHIIRNSIDHGIEQQAHRIANGKAAQGKIKITAQHESGNVVIEVEDDGGGIDPERIKAKAIEKGLITEDAGLTDQELVNLIFHPGFSTAAAVTNLSGRGVGMDVVKRNIEELQGSVQVISKLGIGTLMTIRLPLTMAIIDGFHIATSKTDFIIPQNTLVECIDFDSVERTEGGNGVNLRGEYVPYLTLSKLLNLPEQDFSKQNLVIVQFGKQRAGILVDELFGEMQTVVKPLSPIFKSLKGVGGCSLLGNGNIAFILDVAQLIEMAAIKEHAASH